ncbi:MAG: DUF748 domain-containing protein [Bacteroidales bacterium]|nr:DUF748 domain-containing protein [Bacteroidales bacterium]
MKKGVKILLWIVGGLVALVLLVSLLAGPIAKGYVNRHGEDITGRKVHVGHVGLNLFTGHVNIRDLDVYEDDAATVFAGFDTLDVNVRLLKIPFHTLHFGHITLAGFHADVKQQGDRFNFNSLIEHFASDDTTADQDTTPSDWVLKFYNIRLSHARLNYDDLATNKGWHLPDVNLRVPGFVLGGEGNTEGGLNIGFDQGGRLGVEGNYDSQSNNFDLTVSLADFAVANLESYLADMLRYESIDGNVYANLKAEGNLDEIMRSSISGNVAVSALAVSDANGPVAAFDTLAVTINNICLDDNRFDIASVRLGGLKATYEQWKEYSNIDRLLTPESGESADTGKVADTPAQPADTNTAPTKPLSLHVGSFVINNAALTYVDHTLPDPFSFAITKLGVEATDLTTEGENNARLQATLQGGGKLNVLWNGDISNWKQHQDLFLTIRGLDMRQFTPWSVAYTAQPIDDGIFGLSSHTMIANSKLVSKDNIDIYKLRVGDRRKDIDPEVKLPLKTALYILRDKDDKIQLPLSVSGNVDNPEFNYMKALWKTLGNLLVKVATSPVRALGNAFGLSGDDLEFLAVKPDQHILTSEQYHVLSSLATIVQSDSLLTLTLERQMPVGDSVAYQRLDSQISNYLIEQGLPQNRFSITVSDSANSGRSGYAILSQIAIE